MCVCIYIYSGGGGFLMVLYRCFGPLEPKKLKNDPHNTRPNEYAASHQLTRLLKREFSSSN